MNKLKANSFLIKEVNSNIIREAIKKNPASTKPQIAKITKLTTVTVGTILNELLKRNEVVEISNSESTGGRPAKKYSYNNELIHCLILFPFEKDDKIFINITVSNLGNENLYKESREMEQINITVLKSIVSEFKTKYSKIKIAGFGNRGVNANDKIIFSNHKDLEGLNLSKELELPVIVENDVNAAALGFQKRKQIFQNKNMVYLFFPETSPPGSAIIINNKLYKGNRNYAGEIVNIPGFEWNRDVYNNYEQFTDNLIKIIEIISAIINPEFFILNGYKITDKHFQYVKKSCEDIMTPYILPDIFQSKNFFEDMELGLKEIAVNHILPNLILTKE